MRTERRRRRGRREIKSKGRGTASVTPRTGRKTGTVTEGTSRSIKGWIGLGPPPEPDVRATALKRAACASPRGRRKSQPVRGEEPVAGPVPFLLHLYFYIYGQMQ